MTSPSQEEIELVVPSTKADFDALGRLKAVAFADKGALCGGNDPSEGAAIYQKLARLHAEKLQHGRMARLVKTGKIVGGMQLQLQGDVGDLEFPFCMRDNCQADEAYIEYIATSADHRGMGIGSQLLAWAESFAKDKGCNRLTLDVMTANTAAIRLYERKGYVIADGTKECACCVGCLCFCMSCGKYWGVDFMVKRLDENEPTKKQATIAPAPTPMIIHREDDE